MDATNLTKMLTMLYRGLVLPNKKGHDYNGAMVVHPHKFPLDITHGLRILS
jgi:hypothetical protein